MIPGRRGKEIATANSTLIVAQLLEISRFLLRRYLPSEIKAEHLIFVRLDTVNFINIRRLKVVNSYISVPIPTRHLLAIM